LLAAPRIAASSGNTLSRIPPQGGNTCGLAKPVPRCFWDGALLAGWFLFGGSIAKNRKLERCGACSCVESCSAFDALASDAAPAEQAYARYLKGAAQAADAPLLPEAHRGLVGATAAPDAALAGIADPMSRLVAAGVLFRRGLATPGTITQAVDTASARGWRRPLLAWLQVQLQRAQAAGAADEVARIQRRIDVVLGKAAR